MPKHAVMLNANSTNCRAHALRRVAVLWPRGMVPENRSGSQVMMRLYHMAATRFFYSRFHISRSDLDR